MKLELLVCLMAIILSVDSVPLVKKTNKKLLVISFDGFRWDYDQDVDTPNMDKMVQDGVKAKYITPPAITMTSPSHFTTITGKEASGSVITCSTPHQLAGNPMILYYNDGVYIS